MEGFAHLWLDSVKSFPLTWSWGFQTGCVGGLCGFSVVLGAYWGQGKFAKDIAYFFFFLVGQPGGSVVVWTCYHTVLKQKEL